MDMDKLSRLMAELRSDNDELDRTTCPFMDGLSMTKDELGRTQCFLDSGAQLLIISDWSRILPTGVVIAFTIADETDQLEWACMIETDLFRRAAGEDIHVKISTASLNHRFVVTGKVLRRTLGRETVDAECFKVSSESSYTAANRSLDGVAGVARTTTFPVFDVRPHLRSNVGIKSGDIMHSIGLLTAGSPLPTTQSKSFICSGDSVQLQIYQGDSNRVSLNKRVHSVKLEFQSKEPEKTVEVALDVTEDGTLTTAANERIYSNVVATQAPRIIDVICPKIAIDTRDPELKVNWTQRLYRPTRAFLSISTTYAEVHRWRIAVDEAGVATGNGGGHLLQIARVDFSQRIEIPSDVVETGTRYNVTVEGLQLIDDRVVGSAKNFRIICRNSATLEPIAQPAGATTVRSVVRSSRPDDSISSVESIRRLPPQRSPAVQVDLDLRIQIERSTFHQASVVISTNPQADLTIRKWKIIVKKIAMATGPVYYSSPKEFVTESKRFEFPLQFEAGHRYRVTVAPMEWSDGVVRNTGTSVEKTAEFRAELTLNDLRALYSVAKQLASYHGSSPCKWLYRNKSAEYFQKINHVRGGIMEVYDKDNSGDPASPISLQIKGLFFMASVEQGTSGEPKRNSPFGPLRICIPAEELLGVASNVYFVDFYCMRGQNHQVTLVMTKPGSTADIHCAQRLLPLDLHNPAANPFFFYDASRQLRVSTREHLLVELLYTEDIDISRYPLKNVPTVGRGSSTPGGLPKNANCGLCNLHGRSAFQKF